MAMLGGECSECCECTTKWSQASAIEVELQFTSTFRETVAVTYPLTNFLGQIIGTSHDYATQQACPGVYTGVFSLTKTSTVPFDSQGGVTWNRSFWSHDFGNGTFIHVAATDGRNFNNTTWDHLSLAINYASAASWKRFSQAQVDPYPSESTMCSGVTGDCRFSDFGFPAVPSSTYCNSPGQVQFFTTALTPPGNVELGRVAYYCSAGKYFSRAESLLFGGVSAPVDENTLYPVFARSLMMDPSFCDRFRLTSSCVSLKEQSPAGLNGTVQIGAIQIKSLSVFF